MTLKEKEEMPRASNEGRSMASDTLSSRKPETGVSLGSGWVTLMVALLASGVLKEFSNC